MRDRRKQIESALDDGRLYVKVGRTWWLARRAAPIVEFSDGDWLVRITARIKSHGYITSVNNNAEGREFRVHQ